VSTSPDATAPSQSPSSTPIPLKWVGPLRITAAAADGFAGTEELSVPLATYETPLWPSVGRGGRVSMLTDGGIRAVVVDERMSRSILLEADDAATALAAWRRIEAAREELQEVVSTTSRFARLIDLHVQIVGDMLFVRFELTTGDASGHNMVTLAADRLMDHLLRTVPGVRYGSISGNYCTDKKPSAVNGILGRGKNVVTEITIPQAVVEKRLRTSAERVERLNLGKNLIGGIVAGSLRSANAHYANMLLGFYLATGQDAANIVEGSQGITRAENRDGDLYFSCTLPHLIVGSVGNGKGLPAVEEALTRLGCREEREPGVNGRRLAVLAAASVLCGELSLLAAQTNPGELMRSHVAIERGGKGA